MSSEIQSLRAEVAALRGEVRRKRRYGRLLPVAIVTLFVALIPGLAIAANPFNDLVGGSPHNGNIDLIYNAGITTGCVPNVSYCPTDLVTRQEMASFLARTAGLGGNTPVANARTLQGFQANTLSRVNVDSSQQTTFTLSSSFQSVAALTITAPSPGFIAVHGAVTLMQNVNGGAAVVTTAVIDNASGLGSYPLLSAIGSASGYAYEGTASPTILFRVTSGGSYTYALIVGRDSLSSGTTYARYGTITATYTPFGPGGAQGAESPVALTHLDGPIERVR